MASIAQTGANRSNAQKSTGPRTAQGKALVAQNAVKHGLLAQRVVVKGEDPGEFALFRGRMRDDLGPQGILEGILADRVVNLAWRLRRAERLESTAWSMLEDQQVTRGTDKPAAGSDPDEREAALARAVVEDFRYGKVLDRLLGYERRIENSLYRTMNELRKARLLRQVEEVSEEVSSVKCKVSSGQSQRPGIPSLPTEHFTLETLVETPHGVTTNGGESEDELRQTKPEEVTGDQWHGTSQEVPDSSAAELATSNVALQTADPLCETNPTGVGGLVSRGLDAEAEEAGRGRPGYEEVTGDRAQHSSLPSFQDSRSLAGQSCETKPNEETGEKSQVTSQPG